MRINKYIALSTKLSRRKADQAVAEKRVKVNGQAASTGQEVTDQDSVTLNGHKISPVKQLVTIKLNKPVGYVVSRNGQGSQTIYDLLPRQFHKLNPIGRLDKDSSGLLLLTNDGDLIQELTHPTKQKQKIYSVELNKPLRRTDRQAIEQGVILEDGISKLQLNELNNMNGSTKGQTWQVSMHEGRNRQIRRTFEKQGYRVTKLHRQQMGKYKLANIKSGQWEYV